MNPFKALTRWFRKTPPSSLTGGQWSGTSFVDAFKKIRNPTPNELMAELKGTAWTCASLNASVCASNPPRLYVTTSPGQNAPKCHTRPIGQKMWKHLTSSAYQPYTKTATRIQEVTDHPLLTLLSKVNPVHNAFDLWELTTLYQEVHGAAFWKIERNPLRVPIEIWPLPTQNVTPTRYPGSRNIVDYYEYRAGAGRQEFKPDDIIHFRYPDPRDPYLGGMSPTRAVYESIVILGDYGAMRKAKFENRAVPDAIISPDEPIGEEERDRFETQWNQKFRRGGTGKVAVGESKFQVTLLNQSMGDLAALAEMGATKEDIANAYHVPLAFLTSNTNLANLLAANQQHMSLAISPRLLRRDEKLNEALIPQFDPSGRLFVASEDPVPTNWEYDSKEKELDIKYGVKSINNIREAHGLEPVEWGKTPWLPLNWKPTDRHIAEQIIQTEDKRDDANE